jgi:hypothetical protein
MSTPLSELGDVVRYCLEAGCDRADIEMMVQATLDEGEAQ